MKKSWSVLGVLVSLALVLALWSCAQPTPTSSPAPKPTPSPPPAASLTPTLTPAVTPVADAKKFKFNSSLNANHYVAPWQNQYLSDITQRTGGKLTWDVYWETALGFPYAEYLRVSRDGLIPFTNSITEFHGGDIPQMTVGGLPMLLNSAPDFEKARVKLEPVLSKILDENWKSVLLANHPVQANTLFTTKPAKTLADLKGMKVRTSTDAEAEWCKAIGMIPVTVPSAEIYTALQRGTIDAVITAPGAVFTRKQYEVVKYRPIPAVRNMWLIYFANKDVWQGLPADWKKAINDAKEPYHKYVAEQLSTVDQKYEDELKKVGMDFTPLSSADLAQLTKMAEPVWGAWANRYGAGAAEALKISRQAVGK